MWNEEIISQVALDDKTENQSVVKACTRIAAKGFHLIDARCTTNREGFNWGRSSHGETRKVIWSITFENDANEEFSVCLIDQIISYTKCNPHDKAPKASRSVSFLANAATKAALEWK